MIESPEQLWERLFQMNTCQFHMYQLECEGELGYLSHLYIV